MNPLDPLFQTSTKPCEAPKLTELNRLFCLGLSELVDDGDEAPSSSHHLAPLFFFFFSNY